MIFDDDVTVLKDSIFNIWPSSDKNFHDKNDLDVDKHFNSSPLTIQGNYFSFERVSKSNVDGKKRSEIKELEARNNQSAQKENLSLHELTSPSNPKHLFREVIVERINRETYIRPTSSLTTALAKAKNNPTNTNNQGNWPLTIYLPDHSIMNVQADERDTVDDVIKKILNVHKQQSNPSSSTKLINDPSQYILQMHEGDGVADEDFKVEGDMILQKLNLKEFCLVEAGDDNDSDFPAFQMNKDAPENLSEDEDEYIPDNHILVVIPNVGQLLIALQNNTTFRDLLPELASKNKLKLYTDEYVFKVPHHEKIRLKLMLDVLDMSSVVRELGAKHVELHRRAYVDLVQIVRPRKGYLSANEPSAYFTESVPYNAISASALQEWNIVKRNRMGRRQERVMGIDGKYVYNGKKGQYSSGKNGTGVHRPKREISSIRNVDIIEKDKKSFKITWIDKREQYDYEYTCETAKDCSDIVSKLKYIMRMP